EYGSDDAIVANLTALARAGVPIVAGSVTTSSAMRKRMIAQTSFRLFARGLEGFAPLAERGSYAIAESRPAVVSEHELLRPPATVPTSQRQALTASPDSIPSKLRDAGPARNILTYVRTAPDERH